MELICEICGVKFDHNSVRRTCGKECKRELARQITKAQFADPEQRRFHQEATIVGMQDLDMKAIVRSSRRSYKGEGHPSFGKERDAVWRANISKGNKGKLKGKTWNDIMGPEMAAIRRSQNSDAMINTNERLLNDCSSDLERYVADCMLGFERNKRIGKWVVDLVHRDVKIIVEVNGDYWHGNPRVYPPDTYITSIGMTAGEKNAADNYRNDQLRQMGYDVVVLWESDIRGKTSQEIRRMVREEVERNLCAG